MERLWQIIHKENIWVEYCRLGGPEKVRGLYLWYDGPLILLDEGLLNQPRLHKCVLAEEIRHFYTASPSSNLLVVHTSYSREVAVSRDERRALKWATDFLMPDREFFLALKRGYRTCHDLAEYFDVTEWFVHRKWEFFNVSITSY